MGTTAVIYRSVYGSTKQYALWLAEELGCEALEGSKLKAQDLAPYETLVFGGGLYAGGISGAGLLAKSAQVLAGKRLALFTVGLADPEEPQNRENLRAAAERAIPEALRGQVAVFHLRGGMDYSTLRLKHRIMMRGLRGMLLRKSEANRTAEDRAILESFGGKIDLLDRATLAPILEFARS